MMKDAYNITCQEPLDMFLEDMNYDEICLFQVNWLHILIVAEVVLLAVVVLKLCYDVLQYRRTGHLPWVARHLCCSSLSSNRWTRSSHWWTWPSSSATTTTTHVFSGSDTAH